MQIVERKLAGTFEITLNPRVDERGFFVRTYDKNIFAEAGIDFTWVQENHSRSQRKGIIRGLHFQLPPFAETKMVRCLVGTILDVFVDLRKDSPTFGHWDSLELSAENKKMILIPRGFAHGFATLSDVAEVAYKVDNYYSPAHECALLYNDPELGIAWPNLDVEPFLSPKDQVNPTLKQFIEQHQAVAV